MDAHGSAKEQAGGYFWFFVVGLLAIGLSVALATVDKRLSESDGEKRLGATLRELRTAQGSLPARATDSRQNTNYVSPKLDVHAGADAAGH